MQDIMKLIIIGVVASSVVYRILAWTPDPRPRVVNPIPPITVELGVYFQISISNDTFYDTVDGDTKNLALTFLNSQFEVSYQLLSQP